MDRDSTMSRMTLEKDHNENDKGCKGNKDFEDNKTKENMRYETRYDKHVNVNKKPSDNNNSESEKSFAKDSPRNKLSSNNQNAKESSLDTGMNERKRSQDKDEIERNADFVVGKKSMKSPIKEHVENNTKLSNELKVTRLAKSNALNILENEETAKTDKLQINSKENLDNRLDEPIKTRYTTRNNEQNPEKPQQAIDEGQKKGGEESSDDTKNTVSDVPSRDLHDSNETTKGLPDPTEITETTGETNDADETSKSAGTYRTRLSTGSIFFDSELLKTSPSKLDPPADRSERREKRVLDVKKKLSLSPSRNTTIGKLSGQKSQRQSFFFTHGYAKCEHCKKVFWKMKRYRQHVRRCSHRKLDASTSDSDGSKVNLVQIRKKRPLSLSPGNNHNAKSTENIENKESEDGNMRKRMCRKQIEHSEIMGKDDSELLKGNDKDKNHTLNQSYKPTKSKFGSHNEPGTSTSYFEESDDDSDFSGFSEVDEDMLDKELEIDNTVNDNHNKVGAEGQDMANESPLQVDHLSSNESENRVTRQAHLKNRSLTDKKKSNLTRSFVCDSDKRGKMVCQVSKDIDKIIDTVNLVCRHCDSKHTRVSNLRQHAIRHLGWKRYECKLCSFSNYNLSQLKLHLSRKHCIKGYEIDVMQYVYDLKTEAKNRRASKRSNTLRKHKAKGISTKSSPSVYAKPRPSLPATTTKAGRNIKRESTGATSLSPLKAINQGELSSDSTENTPLSRARQRLSNVLKS